MNNEFLNWVYADGDEDVAEETVKVNRKRTNRRRSSTMSTVGEYLCYFGAWVVLLLIGCGVGYLMVQLFQSWVWKQCGIYVSVVLLVATAVVIVCAVVAAHQRRTEETLEIIRNDLRTVLILVSMLDEGEGEKKEEVSAESDASVDAE